jgi:hypothetical protein
VATTEGRVRAGVEWVKAPTVGVGLCGRGRNTGSAVTRGVGVLAVPLPDTAIEWKMGTANMGAAVGKEEGEEEGDSAVDPGPAPPVPAG